MDWNELSEGQRLALELLCSYNALFRWFDKAAGVQISWEDAVKLMLWLGSLKKVMNSLPDYQFASDNYEKYWPVVIQMKKDEFSKLLKESKNDI